MSAQNKPDESKDGAPESDPSKAPPSAASSNSSSTPSGSAGSDPTPPRGRNSKPPELSEYHVAGPGSLMFRSKLLAAGTSLRLTEEEAEELGDEVKPGKASVSKAAVEARKAGVYKVRGPGSVYHDGRHLGPGELLELGAANARSLGDAVEEV